MNDFLQILSFGLTLIFCVIAPIAFMLYGAHKGIVARQQLALRIREARKSGKLDQLRSPRNTVITRLLAAGALLVVAAFLMGLVVVAVWPTLLPPSFTLIFFAVLMATGIAIGIALYQTMIRML
ncbi:MAG: hypothetical protein ABI847_11825 [Anaerolineales bacterium]